MFCLPRGARTAGAPGPSAQCPPTWTGGPRGVAINSRFVLLCLVGWAPGSRVPLAAHLIRPLRWSGWVVSRRGRAAWAAPLGFRLVTPPNSSRPSWRGMVSIPVCHLRDSSPPGFGNAQPFTGTRFPQICLAFFGRPLGPRRAGAHSRSLERARSKRVLRRARPFSPGCFVWPRTGAVGPAHFLGFVTHRGGPGRKFLAGLGGPPREWILAGPPSSWATPLFRFSRIRPPRSTGWQPRAAGMPTAAR